MATPATTSQGRGRRLKPGASRFHPRKACLARWTAMSHGRPNSG
eukprot:CAMPEP_0203926006 /NCGR_PEP_ID=MMETSP0359-20131031/65565_1 /ASSEMBLY_ACC=CAM_ASM_000338 /TAXON_ID=268821 /ORGANISM="Scrippsiella Hangoei, Strain SHTV-5" /LENGTH=43 /DNA_ID= /DNA_START= /DNA_END= /DNA_ORIENTATION=